MNNFSGTEKHAFSKIYLIYFPKLVRFAREYVGSIEAAENIVPVILMYLWEIGPLPFGIRNPRSCLRFWWIAGADL